MTDMNAPNTAEAREHGLELRRVPERSGCDGMSALSAAQARSRGRTVQLTLKRSEGDGMSAPSFSGRPRTMSWNARWRRNEADVTA
ncbi:hypothetical protein ACQEVZ_10690 [Dactylosporangium sp. CA-152071]|uniref:hypothetical protein n=1 Tax=Dactylosporangium sp. CA-152071 TaxID=3239933 RepID=UPI003D935F43